MQRINEVSKDCFNALAQLRAIDGGDVDPSRVYERLCGFVDQLLVDARALGYEELDVVDMAYAIVALADEIALRGGGAVRELWMQRPLQLRYFNENRAGEGFFRRLDAVLADPGRAEILRVYYTCLLFGFQGQFAVRGGELELDAIIQRVKQALRAELGEQPLSAQALRPKEGLRGAGGFSAIGVASMVLLFALGLLIVLRIGLDGQREDLVERMANESESEG
jgi:type VI secretion system protein ImpK